jgi:hypothetical protein
MRSPSACRKRQECPTRELKGEGLGFDDLKEALRLIRKTKLRKEKGSGGGILSNWLIGKKDLASYKVDQSGRILW